MTRQEFIQETRAEEKNFKKQFRELYRAHCDRIEYITKQYENSIELPIHNWRNTGQSASHKNNLKVKLS